MQGKMSDYSFRRHFSDVSALQTQTSDTQREEFACMGASKTFVAPSDSVSVCVCLGGESGKTQAPMTSLFLFM